MFSTRSLQNILGLIFSPILQKYLKNVTPKKSNHLYVEFRQNLFNLFQHIMHAVIIKVNKLENEAEALIAVLTIFIYVLFFEKM